jgi:hypothetical protein
MTDPRPVTVYRSELTGRWYATAKSKPYNDTGAMIADARSKRDVANHEQLEEMWDNHSWLLALLRFTGKTREQIAADYDCEIAPKDAM